MFSQLGDKLQDIFKDLRGHGTISETNINDALRQVRLALLEADVDFQVAKNFVARIKEKALGEEVLRSITPGQQIVKIFHDELTALLGGDAAPLNLGKPARILMVGLNGAGKTTSAAKLARLLKKQGYSPRLVAMDLQRPAAIEQLATLGKQIDVTVFTPAPNEKDVLRAAAAAVAAVAGRGNIENVDRQAAASDRGYSIDIFDTAGRQEIDQPLVEELKRLREFLQPQEILLVADAATGQQAVSVATHFNDALQITGIVLTKLDGDARGGAALSMREVTQRPIKFAGIGEKLDQFEIFVPDRLAGRILGPLENILGMLPGMSNVPGLSVDERQLRRIEAIVLSMTPQERTRPDILNARRRQRIARGSGRTVTEVNDLLQRFNQMRKLMKNAGKMKRKLRELQRLHR